MKDDPYFRDFDIFVVGYPSSLFRSSYTVDELVEVLRRDLDNAKVFANHKYVYFLCHSMGGLVVRGYLTRYQKRGSQVPMVYFFSTPTTGTAIANLGTILSHNRQIQGVLPLGANEYLASVQKSWLAAQFSIASYCGYETQDTYGVRIVSQESATNLCNRRLDPINVNHLQIVKPSDRTDVPYVSFQTALQEVRPEPTDKRTSQITVEPERMKFAGKWDRENYVFVIANKSDNDVYSVQLKFNFEGGYVANDGYDYDLGLYSRKPIVPGSDFADTTAMNCTNIKTGGTVLIIWIYRLQPKERREVTFTHEIKHSNVMHAWVTSFTKAPQPRVDDPKAMCLHIVYPGEPVRCSPVLFSMDPSKPKSPLQVTVTPDQPAKRN